MSDPMAAAYGGGDTVSTPDGGEHIHRPEFSGRTGEYFGIWFVNLLLSIVTLGIYSAWAKVRTERYFYAQTRLAGASFEYLASPIAILKGRLIAYAVVIVMLLSSHFLPWLYFALLLAVFALVPALIVLSMRFRARNSAWRGLTFSFHRTAGSAYGPFMGWPILSAITGTLLYPFMVDKQHAFVSEGHAFGRTRFEFRSDIGKYYVPYGIAAACFIALFGVVIVTVVGMGVAGGAGTLEKIETQNRVVTLMMFMMFAIYMAFFAIGIYLRTRYANLFWNHTHLGEHRFASTLRVRDMMWLYASNVVAIVCTLGLAVPWAMIRLARYRAAHFAFVANGSLGAFTAGAGDRYGATGQELVDALDVGVDFGV